LSHRFLEEDYSGGEEGESTSLSRIKQQYRSGYAARREGMREEYSVSGESEVEEEEEEDDAAKKPADARIVSDDEEESGAEQPKSSKPEAKKKRIVIDEEEESE